MKLYKSPVDCHTWSWCITYTCATPLCSVPCMLCRNVLVVATTEQSSVPATMSPSEGRVIHGSFTIVSA